MTDIETKKLSECSICGSDSFVDEHHYDCQEGKVSPETISLCRRCHRTYHNLGIDWFDDCLLDKAIELENKTRELLYSSNSSTKKLPLVLLTRDDIRRSNYWNRIHKQKLLPRKTQGRP